ncbi:phycobilisome rod-core linker polypeptide [filamentous cyanobacterium LEGE 11480]|uniref:Phycobilisome rod-core linker polypeptide n=1 Tax=Romeriopsis navalis LEGE 11480 TaxID=2777977 RepID=A0A928VJW5_9CYAN|nr:phycobilisome rod-core linker polypeptide [Romeriopsis navalis]MBE9029968.1 phycobilisome rod-core linker polypeptide [Romeriopsis navalis LEGE 11480]
MNTLSPNPSLMANPVRLAFVDRAAALEGIYRQLFKENRNFDFFRDASLDSAYIDGRLNTREMVRELLCGEMYRDYILGVNSNYHFVQLCFERVLGRPPEQTEKFQWSSLLASEGLNAFATKLTNSAEYTAAFGDDAVPSRRSLRLFTSDQNLPALPKEQSTKRYTGDGIAIEDYFGSTFRWEGRMPPKLVQNAGSVLIVAGVIELVRIAASTLLHL